MVSPKSFVCRSEFQMFCINSIWLYVSLAISAVLSLA